MLRAIALLLALAAVDAGSITVEAGGSIIVQGGDSTASAAGGSSASASEVAALTAELATMKSHILEMARMLDANGMTVPSIALPPAPPPPPPAPRAPLPAEAVDLTCSDDPAMVASWIKDGVFTIPEGVETITDDFGNCADGCAAMGCGTPPFNTVTTIRFPSTLKQIGRRNDNLDEPFFLSGNSVITTLDFSKCCALEYIGDETFRYGAVSPVPKLPCCLQGSPPTIEGSSLMNGPSYAQADGSSC